MKEIKVEWCKNWVKATFKKLPFENGGIERNLLFQKAEEAGLYVQNTYGSPISEALMELTKMETIHDENGNFKYHVF